MNNCLLMVQVMEAYSKLIMHRRASKVNAKQFIVWSVQHCSIMATITGLNLPANTPELAEILMEYERVWCFWFIYGS